MPERWGMRRSPVELAARYRDAGFWTDETLGELLDAHLQDERDLELRVWSSTRPRSTTMGAVHERSRRFASALQLRGVEPGDVVAFQLPNCVEAAIVFWGAALCGAVVVPIVHFYGRKEVGYALRDSGARVFVTADRFGHQDHLENVHALAPELGDLDLVAVVRFAPPEEQSTPKLAIPLLELDDLLAVEPIPAPVRTEPDAPALLAYTSGTTADPKGVLHTHRSIVAEIKQLGDLQPPHLQPTLTGAPVGHAIGMLSGLLLPVYRGRPIHLIDGWDPEAVLQAMVDADLHAGSGATYFLTSLLDAPGFGPEHLERMRWVGLGGSSVPEAIADRAIAMGISIVRSYGSTEHPSITGASHDAPQDQRKRTDGHPLAGVEIRLVDGEIWSRGPDLCAGYTSPALTAAAFDDEGWYRTGDIGVLDEDGWLTITDRLSDVIIRGGENISAVEVESLLLRLPGVADAAVVAAPDERLGEHAAAIVRATAPVDLELIRSHLAAAGLARQKWPEELHTTDELPGGDFPRTPSGKVKKHELREWIRSR